MVMNDQRSETVSVSVGMAKYKNAETTSARLWDESKYFQRLIQFSQQQNYGYLHSVYACRNRKVPNSQMDTENAHDYNTSSINGSYSKPESDRNACVNYSSCDLAISQTNHNLDISCQRAQEYTNSNNVTIKSEYCEDEQSLDNNIFVEPPCTPVKTKSASVCQSNKVSPPRNSVALNHHKTATSSRTNSIISMQPTVQKKPQKVLTFGQLEKLESYFNSNIYCYNAKQRGNIAKSLQLTVEEVSCWLANRSFRYNKEKRGGYHYYNRSRYYPNLVYRRHKLNSDKK